MSLNYMLILSALLFTLGLVAFVSRKNTIAILFGVEMILNAAALNFVAFSHYSPSSGSQLDGQIFAIFIIILAAAEAVVALGIVISVYKEKAHIQASELTDLRG